MNNHQQILCYIMWSLCKRGYNGEGSNEITYDAYQLALQTLEFIKSKHDIELWYMNDDVDYHLIAGEVDAYLSENPIAIHLQRVIEEAESSALNENTDDEKLVMESVNVLKGLYKYE